MLKDLEQRRVDLPAGDSLHGLRTQTPGTTRSPQTLRLAGIALAVLTAAGVGWFLRPIALQMAQPDSLPRIVAESVTPPASASADVHTPPAPMTEPATVAVAAAAPLPNPLPAADDTATKVSRSPDIAALESHTHDALPLTPVAIEPEPPQPAAVSTPQPSMRKTLRELAPQDQAEQSYSVALAALGRGDVMAAEMALRGALDVWPAHAQSTESLAAILIQQARHAEAEAVLSAALSRTPAQAPLARLQARLLADNQRDVEALAVLDAARSDASADAEFHALYAALAQRQQQHAQAIAAYRHALALDPRQGAWWMGLGISLEQMREPREAQAAYRKALSDPRLDARVTQYLNGRIAALGQG